jgi:ankyrin repeat protein
MQLSQSDRIKWLLSTARACGDIRVVKQLATQVDSDVTLTVSQALRVACFSGKDDVVKWLMSHTTANFSSCGFISDVLGEMTSLMAACNSGHISIVIRLLQCVTPHTVNMMSGRVTDTALHFTICSETDKHSGMQIACANGDIITVTATLQIQNLDLQIANDFTALHFACCRGDVEIVRMLLSAFANTHITDDERRTPAVLAELYSHTELLPHLRCTLSDPPDAAAHVSTDNNSMSISVLSVEDITQHNTPHTNRSSPGTTSKYTKRSNMRIV